MLVRPLLAALLLVAPAVSQRPVEAHPALGPLAGGPVPAVTLQAPDVPALLAQDAARLIRGVPGPYRYGVRLELPLVLEDAAAWELTEDGGRFVARLRLAAPGAFSLGVEFDDFAPAPGGRLVLHDPAGRTARGAFTLRNRHPLTGELAIGPFPGDTVVLEYSEPVTPRGPLGSLRLRGVIYDYRDVDGLFSAAGGGDEGGCTVNVNCPVGDPYPKEKRSTVRTFAEGGLCSGVILNNTAFDRTPYLYTAQHCGQSTGVIVRFNYQQAGCAGGVAPTMDELSGAVLLASDVDTDGRLMRLVEEIPDGFDAYYHGWSRSDVPPDFAVSMHHPGGTPKKISIDEDGGEAETTVFQGLGPVRVWSFLFDVGGTAGGSSGGPVFDAFGRVRGALTGGLNTVCNDGKYGRLHSFWGDVDLSPWLDPRGTGAVSLVGFDPLVDVSPAVLGGVVPATGPEGGLVEVVLTGSGFEGVDAVHFGAAEAESFELLTGGRLRVATPPGLGTVDVSVTDAFGTSVSPGAYVYRNDPVPQVDLIVPGQGFVAGGTPVTISGPSVVGVTEVLFDGIPGTGLDLEDAQTLTVLTPPGAGPGAVDVVVVGTGRDTLPRAFAYVVPGAILPAGPGHPGGLFGLVPELTAEGDLLPGGLGFTLAVTRVSAGAPGALLVSARSQPIPFKGGTLWAHPVVLAHPVQADVLGEVLLDDVSIALGAPGGSSWVVQCAFLDSGASDGVSMTNALELVLGEF